MLLGGHSSYKTVTHLLYENLNKLVKLFIGRAAKHKSAKFTFLLHPV